VNTLLAKVKKVILDTAEHHPYHKKWVQLAESIANELSVELEVKYEDYVFAIQHGVTDDLGMAGLPQLMVELEDGKIHPVLHEIPLDKSFQPDFEMAKKVALERIRQFVEE